MTRATEADSPSPQTDSALFTPGGARREFESPPGCGTDICRLLTSTGSVTEAEHWAVGTARALAYVESGDVTTAFVSATSPFHGSAIAMQSALRRNEGVPELLDSGDARDVVEELQRLSDRFGTEIEMSDSSGIVQTG